MVLMVPNRPQSNRQLRCSFDGAVLVGATAFLIPRLVSQSKRKVAMPKSKNSRKSPHNDPVETPKKLPEAFPEKFTKETNKDTSPKLKKVARARLHGSM
jgi:hypothetical protein